MYPEQKLPSYHQNLVRAEDKTMQKHNKSTRENANTPNIVVRSTIFEHTHRPRPFQLLLGYHF